MESKKNNSSLGCVALKRDLRLLFIFSILSMAGAAQEVDVEQKAFNYFFSNIFEEKYAGVRSLQFSGKTEKEMSEFGLLTDCFNDNDPVWKKLYETGHDKLLTEKSIDPSSIERVAFRNKRVKSNSKFMYFRLTKSTAKFML